MKRKLLAGLALAAAAAAGAAVIAVQPAQLGVAQVNPDGELQKPTDLEHWVFLGTSLGMGYNPGSFNAARPGQFQVALMEPRAYRYFVEHGTYAPGSMFLLSFYDADTQERSINQHGFTQAELTNYEIHLIDPDHEEGHAFYMFGPKSTTGEPVAPGSACVRCHVQHGAFGGTFAQFYPTIRPRIPKEALAKALQDHDIR